MKNKVVILNPWDSQGVQITDGDGIYPCVRGCGGGGYQQGYVLQHLQQQTHNASEKDWECYGVYSHPMASLMKIEPDTSPTLTAKIAKGSADGPLMLIKYESI